MGGGAIAKPSTVVPMLGVLDDDSSSSEEEIGGGDTSPPKNAEVIGMEHRRPIVGATVEVSEGEAEARPPAAPFHSMVCRASARRSGDAGAADAILDPLHLAELPFNFVFPCCLCL